MFLLLFCSSACNVRSDYWNIIKRKHLEDQWRSILGESILNAELVHIPIGIYMLWFAWYGERFDRCMYGFICVKEYECEKGRISEIVDVCVIGVGGLKKSCKDS